jgi:hypothetical protein
LLVSGDRSALELWEWDGVHWDRVPASSGPSPRDSFAAAWDPARQRLVLFGGVDASGRQGDTWEWNGSSWAQLIPAGSPPSRYGHSLIYDEARGVVTLVGGWASGVGLRDTWAWDGTAWTSQSTSAPSLGFVTPPLAFDRVRGEVMLAVGSMTWTWNGATWTDEMNAIPSNFNSVSVAWDPTRQRVRLLGSSPNFGNETWEWDGAAWIGTGSLGPRQPLEGPMAFGTRMHLYSGGDLWVLLP